MGCKKLQPWAMGSATRAWNCSGVRSAKKVENPCLITFLFITNRGLLKYLRYSLWLAASHPHPVSLYTAADTLCAVNHITCIARGFVAVIITLLLLRRNIAEFTIERSR